MKRKPLFLQAKQKTMRVRFAPSPTGPLHIGGVRTALYNYLLAKKNGGTFILRIEDTDQKRFVEDAEDYIFNSLEWCGIQIDESSRHGGEFGPYRQSERKEIYADYIDTLIKNGHAYKAYDTPEALEAKREEAKAAGNHSWQYDASTRMSMRNSLTLSAEEISQLDQKNTPFTVRFLVPENETVTFTDQVRGEISFQTDVLDDKVLFKPDGMPTYHMANVIDDHLMQITHVIRGEEWLPSTPLHILLYKAFGWQAPTFAHLPLILKPTGKGKLSKRDGAKFGFPVFPLDWQDTKENETFAGFREAGFLPHALVNFLAFLGWNPGTEQEIFSLDELIEAFSLDSVSQAGARFDYDKATWFNQQHIIQMENETLATLVKPVFEQANYSITPNQLAQIITLYKERVQFIDDFPKVTHYLFEDIHEYDEKMVRKKWKPELTNNFKTLIEQYQKIDWKASEIESTTKAFMEENSLGFGQVLPTLRLSVCGTMQGPSIFDVMAFLPKEIVLNRIVNGIENFNKLKENA